MALAQRPVIFRDNALEELRQFPLHARRDAVYQLDQVQHHRAPDNWQPVEQAESGVHDICLTDDTGVTRYVAILLLDSGIHVLHCYQRTSGRSNQKNSNIVGERFAALENGTLTLNATFLMVWDAIENTLESSQHLRLRASLMRTLCQHIHSSALSRPEAAKALGVSQPRIQDLQRGKVNLFGLEALVSMTAAAGMYIDLQIRTPL